MGEEEKGSLLLLLVKLNRIMALSAAKRRRAKSPNPGDILVFILLLSAAPFLRAPYRPIPSRIADSEILSSHIFGKMEKI